MFGGTTLPLRARAASAGSAYTSRRHKLVSTPDGQVGLSVFYLRCAALPGLSARDSGGPARPTRRLARDAAVGSPRHLVGCVLRPRGRLSVFVNVMTSDRGTRVVRDAYGDCRPSLGPSLAARVVMIKRRRSPVSLFITRDVQGEPKLSPLDLFCRSVLWHHCRYTMQRAARLWGARPSRRTRPSRDRS